MRRAAALFLMLAGCASQADTELAALKSARSAVAEWAAVARLEGEGRVGPTYAREMTEDAKAQLASAREELRDPNDPAARLIDGLGTAPPDGARLAAAARALGEMEHSREVR